MLQFKDFPHDWVAGSVQKTSLKQPHDANFFRVSLEKLQISTEKAISRQNLRHGHLSEWGMLSARHNVVVDEKNMKIEKCFICIYEPRV